MAILERLTCLGGFLIVGSFLNFPNGAFATTYVDLSYGIDVTTPLWPTHRRIERHNELDENEHNGDWMASQFFTMSEHTSTHMDAPYHVFKDTWTLSDIPLKRMLGIPGFMIDMSWKITKPGSVKRNYAIGKEDILEWEGRNGKIPPNSVVLVRTGWGEKFLTDPVDFLGAEPKCCSFPGLGLPAAKVFAERGVYGVGIDVVSLDVGYTETFPVHSYLGSRNTFLMENVANLHILPPKGFNLFLFPLRLEGGSGSPGLICLLTTPTRPRESFPLIALD